MTKQEAMPAVHAWLLANVDRIVIRPRLNHKKQPTDAKDVVFPDGHVLIVSPKALILYKGNHARLQGDFEEIRSREELLSLIKNFAQFTKTRLAEGATFPESLPSDTRQNPVTRAIREL